MYACMSVYMYFYMYVCVYVFYMNVCMHRRQSWGWGCRDPLDFGLGGVEGRRGLWGGVHGL